MKLLVMFVLFGGLMLGGTSVASHGFAPTVKAARMVVRSLTKKKPVKATNRKSSKIQRDECAS